MNKVKVCHLTSAHPHPDVRIFDKECVSLAEAGFEVHLVVCKGETQELNGVKVWQAGEVKGGRLARMINAAKAVYKKGLALDADVYHLHDPELLQFALMLKRKGKKVIYDAHEDLPRQVMGKYWIPKIVRKLVSVLIELLENFIVRRLDAVVVATPIIGQRFQKVSTRTVVVNNFPIKDIQFVEPKYGGKQVCYAGGLTFNRGIDSMVAAMHFLPEDFELKLAGRYSPTDFRTKLVEMQGWSKVVEIGYVSRKEVREMVAQSVAGLVTLRPLPNYLESLPIKLFEYMQAGVPVIASNFPYWKTLVEDQGVGVCVDPERPKEIADAMKYISDHPEVAKKMGDQGRKLVAEKYNWEHEAEQLVALYSDLSL